MNSLPSNDFFDPIFEKEDLIKDFTVIWFVITLLLCYIQPFCEFRDQWWVLQSFKKHFETNKRIQEMYPIFHGKLNC